MAGSSSTIRIGRSGIAALHHRGEWQRDLETAAHTRLATDVNAPAVLLDNATANKQPQAHAGKLPIIHIRGAVETFEDMRQILSWNADALIADTDIGAIGIRPDLQAHIAALRAVFDAIFDQIFQ